MAQHGDSPGQPGYRWQVNNLLALNRRMGERMYAGTADPAVVAKRRAQNKRARAARQTARRSK